MFMKPGRRFGLSAEQKEVFKDAKIQRHNGRTLQQCRSQIAEGGRYEIVSTT